MRNTENNKIVGFLGTICSRRLIQGKEFVCCNLVHWFVEKEFRVFAYAFFFPLMEREIIVYATTPRDTIIGIYKRFNFDIKTAKYIIKKMIFFILSCYVNPTFLINFTITIIIN